VRGGIKGKQKKREPYPRRASDKRRYQKTKGGNEKLKTYIA